MGETDDLRAVIEAIPTRTLAAKLRPLMPAIELRLQSGVHLREIVDALNHSAALGRGDEVRDLEELPAALPRQAARGRPAARPGNLGGGSSASAAPPAAAAPIAVTPSMLRKLRSEPIDLEALVELGKPTVTKKGK